MKSTNILKYIISSLLMISIGAAYSQPLLPSSPTGPVVGYTTSTFTGSGNWSTSGRWNNGVPNSSIDATINGTCTVDATATAHNLTINSGASLTINSSITLTVTGNLTLKSDASGTASLINNGTLTINGTTYSERYMTGGKWHIVSPTAAGGSISTFIQAAGNAIPTNSGNYGMMDYNESGNTWNSYFTTSTVGNLTSGKGYSLRRSTDGIVTFTGTLSSGTKTVSLSKSGSNGWNCVGNPYSSAININTTAHATNNFISLNSAVLDASYACLYVWDEEASYTGQNCYKIISNSGFTLPGKTNLSQNYVAPGQGFFVKTAADLNSLQFTAAMQSHQATTALKSGQVSWPGFELSVKSGNLSNTTIAAFNSVMTNGLDPTYDAGLLRKSADLNIYSRLVDDNGVDFAIQCLPETYNNLVIPIGIESKAGGEINFSAQTVDLPSVCKVILEDKLSGTFTSLENGASYKTTVVAGTKGIGRFYIHTSSSTTGISGLPNSVFNLKAYTIDGKIIVEGEVGNQAKAILFDMSGRKLGQYNLTNMNRNSISTSGLANGVYLLNVTGAEKHFTSKIVIY